MRLVVVFENRKVNNLYGGWGLSFLIGDKILFDTGEKGFSLIENIKILNIDLKNISSVVISHDHWDHTGGLKEIVKIKKGNITIYSCENFIEGIISQKVNERTELLNGDILSTGCFKVEYKGYTIKEHGLLVRGKKGIWLITGCAHPGIIKMIEKSKELINEDIYGIIGGFHLKDKQKTEIEEIVEIIKGMGIEEVGPCHCTGEIAREIFERVYERNFIDVHAGSKLEL